MYCTVIKPYFSTMAEGGQEAKDEGAVTASERLLQDGRYAFRWVDVLVIGVVIWHEQDLCYDEPRFPQERGNPREPQYCRLHQ